MTNYNTFYGGNRRKGVLDSTLASGLDPFVTLGYAGHLPRSSWALKQTFSGSAEEWQFFFQANTAQNGLLPGDVLGMAVADPDCRFDGAAIILQKDLPDAIGLVLTIRSNLADPSKDSFAEKTITIPAGSKAGSAYIPPQGSSQDFAVGGLTAQVEFTSTSTDTTDVLDLSGVCFTTVLAIVDFSAEDPCVCAVKSCPADYPAPTCLGQPYTSAVVTPSDVG